MTFQSFLRNFDIWSCFVFELATATTARHVEVFDVAKQIVGDVVEDEAHNSLGREFARAGLDTKIDAQAIAAQMMQACQR